jgi:D-alanyl-D-alanine dipeptidase
MLLIVLAFLLQFQPSGIHRNSSCAAEEKMKSLGLVDVQTINPAIKVSLAYSGKDNFIGFDVYGCLSKAYLQKEVAIKLSMAQQLLQKEKPGQSLLVWDATRPVIAQKILWDSIKKPEKIKHVYVAHPKRGSIHHYGCAVDLTIADEKGHPLDMGTAYDHFGLTSQPRMERRLQKEGKLSAVQIANRKRLRRIMQKAGFMPISSEWWHFNYYSLARAKSKFAPVP